MMGEQMSERDGLAMVAYRAWCDGQRGGPTSDAEFDATFSRVELGWMRAVAAAALAWFAERVEALIDRYDDPGYGMQEDEWRFVRDLRALYATPTTESEDR